MTSEETQKFVFAVIGVVATIGGFVYWHFKTLNDFKDDIHELELKVKDLEKRDELQQQTIDQLNELYPVIKSIMENLNAKRK